MAIVLFYRRGIMGTREFTWDGFFSFFQNLPGKLKHLKTARDKKKGGGRNG